MAKKQLKKLNQPKKYLQGGSNLASVSQKRQTPFYLGQVQADAAQDQFQSSQAQLAQVYQQAALDKKAQEQMNLQELDAAIRNGTSNVMQAAAVDKKAGNLGKFRIPIVPGASGIVAPTLQSSIAANSANAAVNTGVSTISGIGGAPITSSIGASAPGAINIGATGMGGAPIVTNTAANAATLANTAGATAGGLSSTAAAGIAAVGAIGGQVLKNATNDNSRYTSTQTEEQGNIFGSGISSGATGFGIGNMIVPGIGGVIGGLAGATYGVLKAKKENKEAQEEADRLRRGLVAQQGAYQSAFINSRLTGTNPGYAYAGSPQMPTQFTGQYQVAKTGGVKKVPGGQIVPIEGTNAVQFKGRSHKDGGIIIEEDKNGKPLVEVEDAEVMLPLKMKDGKKQDYIFSDYLTLGGKSFAQRSKEILKGGGSEAALQQLAVMQEKMAGRNSEAVAVAKYGGIPQYATGGVPDKDCPPGTIYNAYTGNCEPFSFTSVSGMVTGKTPINTTNVANNNTKPNYTAPASTNSKPAVPVVISNPGKKYSQKEKDAGWKYVYDVAKSLGDPYPEITASQWALESGWGRSNTGTFNPFGQTASKGESGTRLNTPKDPGGGSKRFKNYNSYEEAIQDHINRWAPKYKDAKDPLEAVYMLQNHGGAPRYAEGHNNDWEGYVKKIIKISNSRSENFGVLRSSSYVPDKTKYPKAKGVNASSADTKAALPAPPPVSGDVVPPTFAQRNELPGIGSMQMDEEIQMPEQPKSNITFDPTMTRQERLEKERQAAVTFTDPTTKRPDGIKLFQDPKTKEYVYRDGNGVEIIRGKDRNKLENQLAALQPGATGFDTALAEAEAPVRRRDLTGVKPNVAATTPANAQSAANTQTAIAQQNGTANSPAEESSWIDEMWANQNAAGSKPAAYNAPAGVTPTANGGPGTTNTTAPTINNQNTTFQYTAQTPGYLDYSDPSTAGGIWSGDNYEKQWKPLVASTMSDAAKADQVINYLTNYTGADADDVKAKIAGKSREEQIAIINDLATDTKVGPFHNAVYGAMQQANSGGGNVATNNPPSTTSGTTTGTGTGTTTTTRRYTPCPPGTYLSTDGTCKDTPEYSKPFNGNLVAGAAAVAQLVPPLVGILKPREIAPAISGAPSVKGPVLPRVNMNRERQLNRDMYTATNQAVTNTNTGASGFGIRQAAMAEANRQALAIDKQEKESNRQLAAEEGKLGMQASMFNAENEMKRGMFNAEFKQKQYDETDQRRLGIADALAGRLAGIGTDYLQYKAQDHLARVTNANTHSLERDKMYESLLKDSQNKNSQFYNVPDAELRRIAAGLVEEQMGGVGRTGGVRQYISRLGELKSARATKAKL